MIGLRSPSHVFVTVLNYDAGGSLAVVAVVALLLLPSYPPAPLLQQNLQKGEERVVGKVDG